MGLLIMMALTMLLIMRVFSPIDLPVVASSAAGLMLCASLATAIGMFFSSLTKQNLIAVISSIALLILLWMLGSANFGELPIQAIAQLSIATHLGGFFQGYLQSSDVAYFFLLTVLFLSLSIIRLDSLRQSGY